MCQHTCSSGVLVHQKSTFLPFSASFLLPPLPSADARCRLALLPALLAARLSAPLASFLPALRLPLMPEPPVFASPLPFFPLPLLLFVCAAVTDAGSA